MKNLRLGPIDSYPPTITASWSPERFQSGQWMNLFDESLYNKTYWAVKAATKSVEHHGSYVSSKKERIMRWRGP